MSGDEPGRSSGRLFGDQVNSGERERVNTRETVTTERSQTGEMMQLMYNLIQTLVENKREEGTGRPAGSSEIWGKEKQTCVLDEKYFRHIEMYRGDVTKHRTFVTELLIAIGRLDGRLAKSLKHIMTSPQG